MMQAQRPNGVRLGVKFEAKALIANLGADAYSTACLRAEEASSEDMAKGWRDVASRIARTTRRNAGIGATAALYLSAAADPRTGGDWPFT